MKSSDIMRAESTVLNGRFPTISTDDVKLIKSLRARLTKLQPGTRMLLNKHDVVRLTDLALKVPLYRGRNAPYVSITQYHASLWISRAEEKLAQAVASRLK